MYLTLETLAGGPQICYYHYDALGSVTDLSNSSGSHIEHYYYDPFGNTRIYDPATGLKRQDSIIANPYRFTARRWDSESSLYYYRARMYNPALGRFLQTDPIGYDADLNLYRYSWNNPATFIDPLGEWAVRPRDLGSPIASALSNKVFYREQPTSGQHWQLFYENGSDVGYLGDNPAYTDKPLIGSDENNKNQYYDDPILSGQNDDIMHEAERRARENWKNEYLNGQRYNHNLFNRRRKFDCQEFIWKMIEEYFNILEEMKRERQICP